MSLQGDLEFRDANKITFIGGSSNTLIDLTTGSLGVGVTGTSLSSNLHVAGNKIKVGDNIFSTDGPHARLPKEVPLKKYPEIAFAEGKFDENGLTLLPVQTQAGYTVSASKASTDFKQQWTVFDGLKGAAGANYIWRPYAYNGGTTQIYNISTGLYDPTAITAAGEPVSRLDTNTEQGEWISVEMPKAIKLKHFYLYSQWNSLGNLIKSGHLYAKNTSTDSWVKIHSFNDVTTTSVEVPTVHNVNSTTSYKQFALIVTKSAGYPTLGEWELYGYEEDPPAGDTSVDTTFASIMNTPQTTGANVYVDAKLSSDFTNQVTGPTPVGTAAVHDNTNKYWELTGTLTSNVTLEANTFLEGDQPHAVSVWFNSSNLEANVSNTCVFSVSDQEKLDSVNLDLQSNTWHNLTYAYQGEGGSRVAYLDGRKVLEDQAEDTFGDYPPFAMTGYSQGGYVVSVSSIHGNSTTDYLGWWAFNSSTTTPALGWMSVDPAYTGSSYTAAVSRNLGTESGGAATVDGEYIILEMPDRLRISYANITHRSANTDRSPASGRFYGSNDGITWEEMKQFSGITTANYAAGSVNISINSNKLYKRVALVPTGIPKTSPDWVGIGNLSYYGHRENDLVRLPDPTNVLKYPHIAMTGPAQRGYVASASDFNTSYPAWEAFDDKYTDIASTPSLHRVDRWQPNGGYAITGTPRNADGTETTTLASGSSPPDYDGEWLQLESPNKVNITSYRLYNSTDYVTDHNAHTVVLLGSNTGIDDWVDIGSGETVLSWSPNTSTTNGNHVPSLAIVNTSGNTGFYKYHRLVVRKVTNQTLPVIYQFQLYGTEEATPVPIQIGGGNIDKVANFRVYDKFIGEDQALEIWDAQKDTFRGVKNSVTLQKGRLGIGTTEPEGRLAVLDEPHNLEEFPPRAMIADKTYIEGHGEFCASVSNVVSTTYTSYKAFNKNSTATTGNWWSQSDSGGQPEYSTSTGGFSSTDSLYSTNVEGANKYGQWLQIEFPYKINYKYSDIQAPQHSIGRQPRAGYIVGSNDLSGIWTSLHRFTNVTRTHAYESVKYTPPTVSTQTFKYFRLVIEEMNNYAYAGIARWDIFGTREQGQSVLHDGQLTLTKNLTVPSIGPSVTNTRHVVPKRHKLVLEFDTSTNPTDLTTVNDTSEMGNDGTLRGNAYYSIGDKAFVFDGSGDYVDTGVISPSLAGAHPHSVSVWFKTNTTASGTLQFVTCLGEKNGTTTDRRFSAIRVYGSELQFWQWSNDLRKYGVISADVWYHVVAVYIGGGTSQSTMLMYLNGEQITSWDSDTTDGGVLGLVSPSFAVGEDIGRSAYNFNGQISKPTLYDTALTAGDVKKLYDMGRGDSYHVTNFQNTLVGINLGNGQAPRSALDVRDKIYAESSSVQTFTGQHICFPDESMEKGLIVSAKKNKFVKLNGLATGKSAITIDESLPIVSLSNVSQDKACFGVVSKMEESNAAYRTEITGGLVSESVKIVGDNRAIVNSVGEGAIWVVDTNGPLESGDYITTSNVAGYGQKQDSEFLANYSVAKITMDCDFTASNVAVQTIKREQTGTRIITEDAWNQLVEYDRYSNVEDEITTYYQIQRGENVLDDNGQLQFEDKTGATEEPYERRFLTTDGTQTDEANAVHIAAFVGCTYHCG